MKYIAAEEEWLRLLVHELRPVIEHLHADELPLSRLPPVTFPLFQQCVMSPQNMMPTDGVQPLGHVSP